MLEDIILLLRLTMSIIKYDGHNSSGMHSEKKLNGTVWIKPFLFIQHNEQILDVFQVSASH